MANLSPLLISQLMPVKHRVQTKDMDWWCLVDGREGSGKSSFAFQIASWLDPTFNIDRICYNLAELEKQIQTAPKFAAVVLDEGFSATNARAAMTELNRKAMLLAAEARQRNLFVIICAPSIFDCDKYFAIHRTNCLYNVYFDREYNRGQALFFPYSRKKQLYISGKKNYSYRFPKAQGEPIGFGAGYGLINDEEYRTKKLEAFKTRDALTPQAHRTAMQRDALMMYLWDEVFKDFKGNRLEQINDIYSKFNIKPIDRSIIEYARQRLKKEGLNAIADKYLDNRGSRNPYAIRNESSNGIQIQPIADPAAMQPLPK